MSTNHEPVPDLASRVLDLFRGPLRDVRFPDADADRLQGAVDAATEAAEDLVRCESEVDDARGILAERQRLVMQETERTLAYARVYAAERPELSAALDALAAGASRSPTRRGPGRPRKTSLPAAEKRAAITDAKDAKEGSEASAAE